MNKMSKPVASLIISVYKNTVFLNAILQSLAQQTRQDIEVILSEDGEDPDMDRFIHSFPWRWPWLHLTQPDEGWRKNRALNRAIAASHTNYLIIIDGDCLLHPRFIEMHLSLAQKGAVLGGKRFKMNLWLSQQCLEDRLNPAVINQFLCANLFNPKLKGCQYLEEAFFIAPKHPFGFIPKIRKMTNLKGCNMSFFKEDIITINGFDEDYTKPAIGEDIDITWRFASAGYRLRSVRNRAVQYHLYHQENWSDQSDNQQLMQLKRTSGQYRCANGIDKYL
jgi:GT2 family glycosyltransferase